MKRLLSFVVVAALLNHMPLYAADEYRFTSIQLGGSAKAINNQNQVVGSINNHAFFWDNGVLVDLGMGENSIARDINDNGLIIGDKVITGSSGIDEAFLWKAGNTSTFLARRTVEGLVINNNEQALVKNASRNFDAYGYLVENGVSKEVEVNTYNTNFPFKPFVNVADMNNSGQVVGTLYDTSASTGNEGFLWKNGSNISLGDDFFPSAINDSGQIIGRNSSRESVIYENGVFTAFGDSFNALALNNSGQIVGVGPDGFKIWENGTATNLNDLLDGSVAGWTISQVTDFNDNGWITGNATNDLTGDNHMFVLSPTTQVSPVPEANTFVLVGFGLLSFITFSRRRENITTT